MRLLFLNGGVVNLFSIDTDPKYFLNMVNELTNNVQDWALPPLDEKTACELLELEI